MLLLDFIHSLNIKTLGYVLTEIKKGTFIFYQEDEHGKITFDKPMRMYYAYLSRYRYIDWNVDKSCPVLSTKGEKLLNVVLKRNGQF